MTNDDREDPTLIDQETYENSAKARRVTQIDENGDSINDSNRLPVDSSISAAYNINVALGNIEGTEFRQIFGNSDVDEGVANEQVLGDGMTGRYPFPSSPAQMTIVSDSTDDDSVGTGAQVLLIRGNITGNVELFETILLDGTDPVTTVNSYLRVNSILAVSVGSSGKNIGTITLKNGTDLLAQINPGNNVSRTAVYSVPVGVNAILTVGQFLAGKDDSGVASGHIFLDALGNIDFPVLSQAIYQNLITLGISGFLIDSESDFEMTAYSDEGVGLSNISTLFELTLVDEE